MPGLQRSTIMNTLSHGEMATAAPLYSVIARRRKILQRKRDIIISPLFHKFLQYLPVRGKPIAVTMSVDGTPKRKWVKNERLYPKDWARRACSYAIKLASGYRAYLCKDEPLLGLFCYRNLCCWCRNPGSKQDNCKQVKEINLYKRFSLWQSDNPKHRQPKGVLVCVYNKNSSTRAVAAGCPSEVPWFESWNWKGIYVRGCVRVCVPKQTILHK